MDSPAATTLFYYRTSMVPTFQPGDLLAVVPLGHRPVRVGDVVVFSSPDSGDLIVHRVVASRGGSLFTRGDNSGCREDPWPLTASCLVGRVTHRLHRGKWLPVRGGRLGMLCLLLSRARCLAVERFRRCGLRVLKAARVGELLAGVNAGRLLPACCRPHVLVLQRRGRWTALVVWRGRVVGRHVPGTHLWSIRFACVPLVDRSLLRQVGHLLEAHRTSGKGLEVPPTPRQEEPAEPGIAPLGRDPQRGPPLPGLGVH